MLLSYSNSLIIRRYTNVLFTYLLAPYIYMLRPCVCLRVWPPVCHKLAFYQHD